MTLLSKWLFCHLVFVLQEDMLSNLQRAFRQHLRLDIQRGKTTRELAVARKNWQSLLKILTWKNSIHTNTYAVQICYLSTAETQSSNEILKSRKVFNREDWIQFFLTRKVTALIFPLRPAEALTKPKSCNRSVVVDQKHERRI